jgi:hypothetical protein
MQTHLKQPLTPMQLELLKMFERDVNEKDLLEIKKILVQYFANRAMNLADKVWEEKGWLENDEQNLLKVHNRTPYKRRKA